MDYLYIGYYVDGEIFNEINRKKINNMSVARQNLETNIIQGLHKHLGDRIRFVSYVPTDGEIEIPPQSVLNGITIEHIAINKKSVQSVWAAYKAMKDYLSNMGKLSISNLRVIMYAVIPPFEQAILRVKNKYGIKMVTICSEVPSLRRYSDSVVSKLKKMVLTTYNEKFDGFIFLSEEMKNVVNISNKPYVVVEGIASSTTFDPIANKRNIVMYAGGLAKDNNIPFLIECCEKISDIDEIWICGSGDDFDIVKKLAEHSSKLKYYGQISNEEVRRMEKEAKILLNFRNPSALLTRYSFPSKILEYISSGSLVMSTRLLGIPDEYYHYIIEIPDNDQVIIIDTIRKYLHMNEEDYIKTCKKAQDFVIKRKNKEVQTAKMISIFEKI